MLRPSRENRRDRCGEIHPGQLYCGALRGATRSIGGRRAAFSQPPGRNGWVTSTEIGVRERPEWASVAIGSDDDARSTTTNQLVANTRSGTMEWPPSYLCSRRSPHVPHPSILYRLCHFAALPPQ